MSAIKIEQRRRTRLTRWMGFYAGISAIEIEQRRLTRLTAWMGFHAGIVSDRNRAEEAHTTHGLDGISCRHCQRSKSSRGGSHDSRPGWDFMQALSAIEIEQRRLTRLTAWMGFHAGIVSDRNRAEEAHTTHGLDGISCRHCQRSKSSRGGSHDSRPGWDFMQALSAIEIEQRRRTRLTAWMGFHAGIVSDRNRAEEAHTTHGLDGISCRHCQRSKSSRGGSHDSRPGWDFMQALSAIEIEQRRRTRLTAWMGFHAGIVSDRNRAEEAHTTHGLDGISCRHCQRSKSSRGGSHDSRPGWDFMQALSAIEIEQRRRTRLTAWMGFHAGIVSDRNRAEEAHTTHNLDGISCRHCQRSKSSRGAHDSRPGWDFMQALSAIEIEQRRRTRLTAWMGFHAGIVSDRNRAEEAHTTHGLDGISCRHCQRSKSSRGGSHDSQPGWDFMQALSAIEIEQRRRTQLTTW